MSSLAIERAGHIGRTVVVPAGDIARRTYEGFAQLTELNLETVKTTFAEQRAIAEETVCTPSFERLVNLSGAQTQASLKQALAYWRHASDIAIDTVADNVGLGWQSMDEYMQWTVSWLSDAARPPQAGSAMANHYGLRAVSA
ncbi:MAG TPA: phasin family protein [Trinickia sp.]|uniref:phasin family protein n=1 Tax=Trinickia sp. TaxID=2571163 RepID=UPI002B704148|nr:phasin family protein [Trinickia sp.]HTI17365.1 phasin family protein [Trinickia sp.]